MSAKCYFTGKKAKRACPGVNPGQTVPISAEACTQRMVYEIKCPPDCRHLQGNFDWFLDRTASRMGDRLNEEPWLSRLSDDESTLDLFLELERGLAQIARQGGLRGDDEAARLMSDLQTAARAKSSGLVVADSTFEISLTGPAYHRLALALDYFRAGYFTKNDEPPPPASTFYHRLLLGREQLDRISGEAQTPRLRAFNEAMLKPLRDDVPTKPVIEQRIRDALDVMQRTLDHRRAHGGYIQFLIQFY